MIKLFILSSLDSLSLTCFFVCCHRQKSFLSNIFCGAHTDCLICFFKELHVFAVTTSAYITVLFFLCNSFFQKKIIYSIKRSLLNQISYILLSLYSTTPAYFRYSNIITSLLYTSTSHFEQSNSRLHHIFHLSRLTSISKT